jgi:predicted Zn-dependent protease
MTPATTAAYTYGQSPSGDAMITCSTTFNSNIAWSTTGASGKIDVQACATHEFGHWLSLGHASDSTAVMYYLINFGDTRDRYLKSDDIAGIKAIYP